MSCNYFGNEVVLDRGYFAVKEWPPEKDKVLRDFDDDEEACEWGHWEHIAAIQQEAGNVVRWKK